MNLTSLANVDPKLLLILGLIALWSIPWKGLALWKAARRGDSIWFIILMIINTLAILEIIYIFFVSERKSQSNQ